MNAGDNDDAAEGTRHAPLAPGLQRWRCTVAYDGTGFAGWQSQTGGDAIQDRIEARLGELLGRPVRIHGSGRTDAGVHALAQVFHFDGAWSHGPEKLLAALRTGLQAAIQVKAARVVGADFHARFSATGKRYRYHLCHGGWADPFTDRYRWSLPRILDVEAMRAGAAVLAGEHDFRAFSAFGGVERETTVRHLRRLDIAGRGRSLTVTAEADGFLYKMVRSLVGALVSVGQGKLTPADLETLLAGKRRTPAVHTAPAQGLFLVRVEYGEK